MAKKKYNLNVTRFPEGEKREDGAETMFEEMMTEHLQHVKDSKLQNP